MVTDLFLLELEELLKIKRKDAKKFTLLNLYKAADVLETQYEILEWVISRYKQNRKLPDDSK